MATTHTVSHQAYVKIILHAAKHPHKPVNGVLLGKKNGHLVAISDAVPLLHMWTSLSPMMEIGLDLANIHAESQGLTVVGYYQATERLNDNGLAPVGEKVASKIKENFPDAIAFVLDGQKLGSDKPALLLFTSNGSSWKPQPSAFTAGSNVTLQNPNSPTRVLTLIREKELHHKFGDFDDHIEDVTVDWLNNAACTDGDVES
ncbi:hypothetical protein BU17DRAFT_78696 [Hysterangium stoloniferum]|nr:hypothetical protein BU17DRAFT_78696 [Hysterangium stoloniferum]